MSWWDNGDDVLGDGPADKLTACWRTLLARRAAPGLGPPSTEEALESFAAALRAAPLDPPFAKMVMWRDRDRVREFDGSRGLPELTEAFAAAMEPIARDYQRQTDRRPRPSEVVKTLNFLLRPEPETYLADATEEEWKTLRLRAG